MLLTVWLTWWHYLDRVFNFWNKLLNIYIGIFSLKVICWKQHALKLVRCVCDYILLWTYLKMLSQTKYRPFVGWTGTELSCPQLTSSPRRGPLRSHSGRRPRESAWGWTPLHHAAVNGKVEAAELLLSKGAAVDATDNNGPGPPSGEQGQKLPEEIQHSAVWRTRNLDYFSMLLWTWISRLLLHMNSPLRSEGNNGWSSGGREAIR